MCDDLIGRILNKRYRVQELLGEGKTSSVFTAYDIELDRQVAVKITKAEYALPLNTVERAIENMHSIVNLNHPHILDIYDRGIEMVDNIPRFYLVMQFARRGTLEDQLEAMSQSYDKSEMKRILEEICAALDYAHNRKIYHLNLKPTNVLFDEQGNVMIADFRATKPIQEPSLSQADTDTVAHDNVAPEQLSSSQAGLHSDVYTLGILLHWMLTGKLPEHKSADADHDVHISESLPLVIQSVIKTAIHPDVQQRYRTAGELAEAFATALRPFPDHIIALRKTLCELGQRCENRIDLDRQQVAAYAFTQEGLFSALGYGEPGEDECLKRQPDRVMLRTPGGRSLAVVIFTSLDRSPAPNKELSQQEQQHPPDDLPDVGVLCNGRELWLYQRTETSFHSYPTLHLNLKNATNTDAQAVYKWLGRREIEHYTLPSPSAKAPVGGHVWHWLVVGGLVLTLALSSLFLFSVRLRRPSEQAQQGSSSIQPTTMSLPIRAPSPSPAPQPSLAPPATPTAIPSPTATPMPYLIVNDEQLNVHTGPGEIYDILGQVQKESRLLILGRSEDATWFQVDYLGWPGWVAAHSTVAEVNPLVLPPVETPIPPTNHPPLVQNIDTRSLSIEAWDAISLTCNASDPDDDALTYTWKASGGSIIGEGNSVTYKAPEMIGIQTITVTVRDEHGSKTPHPIRVQIVPVPLSPGTFEPVGTFGYIWHRYSEVQRNLGGATQESSMTFAAQESFERGTMFWREDTDEIYALAQGGSWQVYIDTWEEGMDIYSCANGIARETPPIPIRGIGKVWCQQLGGSNATIGWATSKEQGYQAYWQSFEHGLMWQSLQGDIYVLYEDGFWEFYPYPVDGGSSSCPGAPPQQLQVGDRARVCTAYDRLVMRAQPQLSVSEITLLEPRTSVTVIDGPTCADGGLWWKIRTDSGTVGWVVEGGDDIDPYYICPEG